MEYKIIKIDLNTNKQKDLTDDEGNVYHYLTELDAFKTCNKLNYHSHLNEGYQVGEVTNV